MFLCQLFRHLTMNTGNNGLFCLGPIIQIPLALEYTKIERDAEVMIHYGNFQVKEKLFGLVQPPNFRPPLTLPPGAAPKVAHVWKTEEKGSDVNLGVHLVRDAFTGAFEVAAVLTNDTDLVEPLRIVSQEVGLPVVLLTPANKPAQSLVNVVASVRHIRPYLGPCQFPSSITVAGKGPIIKPSGW